MARKIAASFPKKITLNRRRGRPGKSERLKSICDGCLRLDYLVYFKNKHLCRNCLSPDNDLRDELETIASARSSDATLSHAVGARFE